ncbi:LPXTG cell wall anchor domain-containing protein [Amycolatopsis coloradensis]|uniref:LPXTG cell wall anchor domain-containing protein n=1 Tax=Amycolatopsis coloradensis TaxID=76021 RepID=A0ACD5BB56_9PSEU
MQTKPRRRVRSAVTVVALAAVALVGTAGTALATRSDDRATQVVKDNATTCEGAKVPGKVLPTSDLTFTGGTQQDKYLDITAVAKGVTVTAIVVKGGHGYNVYVPGEKGLPENPPWTQLRSPLNKGDQQAQISHWFVCGEKTKPSEPTKPTEPTKTTTAKPPTTAPTSPDKPSQTSEAPSSTTTAPAPVVDGNGGNGGGLADTGFDNAWLLWAGGLLVLAGAGVLVLLRVRRKAN